MQIVVLVNVCPVVYSERDNFEAELKELKRRLETLDLSHTALTRERDKLSKEVLHRHLQTLQTHNVLSN